jgi:thiamine-phosphate pyrophosphorylase
VSLDRSSVPSLYALTPDRPELQLETVVLALTAGGARWIQVREKRRRDDSLYESLERIAGSLPNSATLFVNDRVDLAIASGAGGVHVGDRDLPPHVIRQVAGQRPLLVGLSTHSVEEALVAEAQKEVDYIAIGPIFPSGTKQGREPFGVNIIEQLRERISKPIIAIGGIDHSNIGSVIRAGADSAAVTAALYGPGAIEDNVKRLIDAAGKR